MASKLILIVDDTPTNLGVVSGVLKDLYRTKVATNGEKALVLAASEKPDLILLDVMMPGMDGYEVCRRLKANPLTRDIPVIFLTAKISAVDEEMILAAVERATEARLLEEEPDGQRVHFCHALIREAL